MLYVPSERADKNTLRVLRDDRVTEFEETTNCTFTPQLYTPSQWTIERLERLRKYL
jgi:hypothetical protein